MTERQAVDPEARYAVEPIQTYWTNTHPSGCLVSTVHLPDDARPVGMYENHILISRTAWKLSPEGRARIARTSITFFAVPLGVEVGPLPEHWKMDQILGVLLLGASLQGYAVFQAVPEPEPAVSV